ncbi:MAG TPA: response regulator [Anaeromyxobacter sp.]|nr:response regulator [Anaeromyxobacter sp.]
MNAPSSIVVVDDDHDVREALGEVLTEEGFDTRLFESARAALEFLRAHGDGEPPPALILLDLMMPGMNGWQFREEQLRDERLKDIPVVVITASRLGSEAIRAREVLFKPVALGDLLDAVHRNTAKP